MDGAECTAEREAPAINNVNQGLDHPVRRLRLGRSLLRLKGRRLSDFDNYIIAHRVADAGEDVAFGAFGL